ncbi:MAG: anti-sigma factor domain-containing protein [Thermoleophilaceae bacterium]
MSTTEHDRHADDAGAYLLGSLTELEQSAFERHLMACAECQQEVARLRPAADAIAHAVEQFEPPPGLKRSLMQAVESEGTEPAAAPAPSRRRRRGLALPGFGLRWPQLAGAAAALVLLGTAIGFGVDRASRDGSSTRVVAAATRLPGASARLHVKDGADASLRVAGMPVLAGGRVYEVWIQHDGVVRPAGALFEVHSDGTGAAAIPHELKPGDRVMVTRERAGGVAQPTEAPVIVARA